MAEIRRDYAKGGLLESAPDKPERLRIRKTPRSRADSAHSAEDITSELKNKAVLHKAKYQPSRGTTQCSAFLRDVANALIGRELPELQGTANQQYDQLKTSPNVETLWSPDGHRAELAAAEEAFNTTLRLSDEIKGALKRRNTTRAAALGRSLDTARAQAAESMAGLAQAFETAQELANRGEFVVVAWKNPRAEAHGHVAIVAPSPDNDPALERSGDWANLRVPYIAQAGHQVFALKPLGFGFRSADSVEDLALFVLPDH
jgi:hypothetical protein